MPASVKLDQVENEAATKPPSKNELTQIEFTKKPKYFSEKALVQKKLKKEKENAAAKELAQKELKKKVKNALEKESVVKHLGRMALEVSKEVVNSTVRKTVTRAEADKKFPPVSQTIQKLAEPRNATYIALYNRYSNVLQSKTVSSVKEKIAGYLE